jgi:hypothetical protein
MPHVAPDVVHYVVAPGSVAIGKIGIKNLENPEIAETQRGKIENSGIAKRKMFFQKIAWIFSTGQTLEDSTRWAFAG